MSIFDRAKAAFAKAKRAFTRVGTDLLKQSLHAGKALVGATPRVIGFKEQMQRSLGPAFINGFERAPVRSPNDGRGDTYGAKQRARKRARKAGHRINYDKVARAMQRWNGAPAITFAQALKVAAKRDALTGVVS